MHNGLPTCVDKKKAHNIRGLMLIWEPRKSSAFYKKIKIKKNQMLIWE
jgi:RNA polymerase subunit RPABC4/transcription elongation factor Spt4